MKALLATMLLLVGVLLFGCKGDNNGASRTAPASATPTAHVLTTSERDQICYATGWALGYEQGRVAERSQDEARARVDEISKALIEELATSVKLVTLPTPQSQRCLRVSTEGMSDGIVGYQSGEDEAPPAYEAP